MPNSLGANLMGYLPPYHHDNTDMVCLMDAENPEIDALDIALVQVRNNQFILTADDSRIRQWEKLLRIRPDFTTQDLDYRKAVVILRLSTRLPLTYRWLIEKLNDTVGADHFVADLYHNDYFLHIRLSKAVFYMLKDLQEYLREKIPANLVLQMDELLKTWGEALNKDYLSWGPVCTMDVWGDVQSLTWGDLKDVTWYDVQNMQVQQRGVLGGEVWWETMRKTWGDCKDMTCAELLNANTWQDVKDYIREGETLAGNQKFITQ